jgi:molybdenum cofactor synthesis domain-containing protein
VAPLAQATRRAYAAQVPTAGIVIIGDEILSGKFADENAAFLIGELRALGLDLRRISVIADDLDDIGATVRRFAERYDHVFTSGGVGPTHDDLTIAGIAAGFGVAVERHPELLARVQAHWGAALAPANHRLADVPAGSELIYGGDPTWPAVRFRNVFIFPGVPALFRKKFKQVRPLLSTLATPLATAQVIATCEEGELAPLLDAVVAAYPAVKLGSYPRFEARFHVLVTFEGPDATLVEAARTQLAAALAAGGRLG